MWKDFKEFVMRGNVVDLAVGFIIGAAFAATVNSLVKDIIMPPVGLLLGKVDFSNMFSVLAAGSTAGPYATLADAQAAGAVTLNYGIFINQIISFLIVALAIFMVVRAMNRLHGLKKAKEAEPITEPTTKTCTYCMETISIKATRCPHCTSQL